MTNQDLVGGPLAGREVPGGSGAMFDAIARRYDLLNRLMTFGIDTRWRRRAIQLLAMQPGARVLDLATGTGDLALAAARAIPDAHLVGVDPSAGMLAVGIDKVRAAGLAQRIEMRQGDAQHLEFADASFDGVTMGFGIRNVPDRSQALREMRRVLRPGGRVVLLEASEPGPGLLGWGARVHLRVIVPRLGALVGGAPEYRYLQESIANFPPPPVFADRMREAGFTVETVQPLLFGVAHLYVGVAPA